MIYTVLTCDSAARSSTDVVTIRKDLANVGLPHHVKRRNLVNLSIADPPPVRHDAKTHKYSHREYPAPPVMLCSYRKELHTNVMPFKPPTH